MVTIRLTRMGRKKTPRYRLVVLDHEKKRDTACIEEVGFYNPQNKKETLLKRDRIQYWISQGAKPSKTVAFLIKKAG